MEGYASFLVVATATAALAWAAVAAVTIVGRIGYDRRRQAAAHALRVRPSPARTGRLIARAERHRSEAGKWKRVVALRALVRERHPRLRALLRWALEDADRDVAGAAVRALGEIDDDWAAELLVRALREGRYPRSLAAAQLERRTTASEFLLPLLSDPDPTVRFWGATLLAGRSGTAADRLIELATDDDPNVRAAATESLGAGGHPGAPAVARERLVDDVWFVRVHACRALGQLGSSADAAVLTRMLGDPWWWVRAAAKDALRGYGMSAAGALLPYLDDDDGFVRNGAAEVLQDIGFLDGLAHTGKEGELRERILAAGGDDMRQTAESRAESDARAALDWRTGS